ncbi:MAG TPA: TIM barrel protein [Verrucomicrobiae bacterium]
MKLGLSSYTYGWAVGVAGHMPAKPLDEHQLIEKVQAHGLKLLQIGDNLPLHTFSETRLNELGSAAAENGIDLEVGARKLTAKNVERYAEIARGLKAKLIRFVIDDRDYHPSTIEVIRILRDSLPFIGDAQLGIENHDRFNAADFRRIIDDLGSDRVGICLDTANSIGAGEGLETVVAALGLVTLNLHIKDFQVKRLPHLMGFTVTGCPAGQGLLDVPWLLQRLGKFGKCRTAILEQWTIPEPEIEKTIAKENDWANASLEYLKPLFV